MSLQQPLKVVLLKPSKYGPDGAVERFRRGYMPNATLRHIQALTPPDIQSRPVEVRIVDEYVACDLGYLDSLAPETCDLLALVGVQSHQFQRGLDLAALAHSRGVQHIVMGGPHPITCDTTELQGRGLSFVLAEAEMVWVPILEDVVRGQLAPVYGEGMRWQKELHTGVIIPPTREELRQYVIPMLGLYPSRGCPFNCTFCSIVQIAGHAIRNEPLEITIASLKAAATAGVKYIMFTSDNFNKIPGVCELLKRIIAEDLRLLFFVQCDTQIAKDEELVALLARAGCFEMFVGVESFSIAVLKAARKLQNKPETYVRIVELCTKYGIIAHFSNMIGFPQQDEASIAEHFEALVKLAPPVISVYVMTPLPGTDQYADFLDQGLISETNLDRFDALCCTWEHSLIPSKRLHELLFAHYTDYYEHNLPDGALTAMTLRVRRLCRAQRRFSLDSLRRKHHPMSGGFDPVVLDRAQDYAELRRNIFGFDLAPLPAVRPLSPEEKAVS
ncbi:MAG: radical SAM protein [bacterium]